MKRKLFLLFVFALGGIALRAQQNELALIPAAAAAFVSYLLARDPIKKFFNGESPTVGFFQILVAYATGLGIAGVGAFIEQLIK